jgi:TolB-like protein/class 3 adenylate cyclase
MALPAVGEMFVFEGFRLDRHGLSRRDERGAFVPVAVGSRALDVLSVLVGRAGDLVAREEIVARVWPTTVVEDNNLNIQIAALRRILDRGRPDGSCIQTISGRGYRFTAPVTPVPVGARAGATAPTPDSLAPQGCPAAGTLSAERVERRLAAILAADVAGYSRLIGADEAGTHERLNAHIAELVYPRIKRHRGRIVKNTGDGFLAEFPSGLDAVRCAAEVQRGMLECEPEVPDDRRIWFRIGINLGDVISEDGDIFSDGVNVAARLEGLAEPGGICVSQVVWDQVHDKLDLAFEDMGDQTIKDIARPVRAYAFRPEGLVAPSYRGSSRPSSRGRAIVGMAAVAMLAILCLAWGLRPASNFFSRAAKPADQATASAPATATVLPPPVAPRLSMVVLPFINLSNDPNQQYFADGITEDLTTDLSRIAHMLVISRNTAFTYQGRRVDTRQIGRELGVRYVLEGSVQRSGNRVRVSAQLIDAESDAHLWAERFDRDMANLFDLQNEITGRIAIALNFELIGAEAARPTGHPEALDYIFRGRAALLKPFTRDSYAEAIKMFERALVLDPGSVEAKSWLASILSGRVLDDMTNSRAVDLERAEILANQALAASPRSPIAHLARGQVLRAQIRYKEAIPEYETVIAYSHNSVGALSAIADCKLHTGPIVEVIPLQKQVLRLSPRDPLISNMYGRIGFAYLLQSQIDEAILWLEKARDANPVHYGSHSSLAAAYGLKGETGRAAAELAEARELVGDDRFSSIARQRIRVARFFENPAIRALVETTFLAGLRKAGVPEE